MDGTVIPADRLRAIRRQLPEGSAAVLARWDDGKPLLVRHVVERGTAWFFGTLPDYTWSNLGDGDVLLPLIQRAVTSGADRFESAYLADVGSTAATPVGKETRQRLDDLSAPDPANSAYEAGVWRLGDRVLAVNRPASEDLPEALPHETLGRLLDGIDHVRCLRTAPPMPTPTRPRGMARLPRRDALLPARRGAPVPAPGGGVRRSEFPTSLARKQSSPLTGIPKIAIN